MARCDYCGKEVYMPFRCPYCGGLFCEEHRLPEAHNCPSLRELRNVPHYSEVHAEYVIRKGRATEELLAYALLGISLALAVLFVLLRL